MDVDTYLLRMGYEGDRGPSLRVLEALCRAHLMHVPFENFDIHLGVPISLEEGRLFQKIVGRRRGGFCYELNLLFARLLRDLGFVVDFLSARVVRAGKPRGDEFDHMALRVWVGPQDFLVDVGFGDASVLPLELRAGASRRDRGKEYRLAQRGAEFVFEVDSLDRAVKSYELSLQSRKWTDFQPMLLHHQSSPDSWFTQERICVLLPPSGRISLIEGVLKLPDVPPRVVHEPRESLPILRELFGVDLPRFPENKAHSLSMRTLRQALQWRRRGQWAWEHGRTLLSRNNLRNHD